MDSECLIAYWHKVRKLSFQFIKLLKGKIISIDEDQVNVFTFAEYKAYITEANRAWWRALYLLSAQGVGVP